MSMEAPAVVPAAAAAGRPALSLVRQERSLGAEADLAFALEMLDAARAGRIGPTLRIYRPVPTVALGQRDARLPGFAAAAAACRDLGFEPLVRRAGGRAAAYHQGCLVVDHVEPDDDAVAGSRHRFTGFGDLFADALRRCGVPAAVGEIPGEYCPGEHSVHGTALDRRQVKLVGTAQRVVAGAWLFSSVIVVQDAAPLRTVLSAAYDALGLAWRPDTAGAAEDLAPGLDVDGVEAELLNGYAASRELVPADFSGLAASL
ncbi:Lipoyl-[GcvH]:protein N-lipoyltransferase [Arthrobacter saudimassiliensis]|uniref:Lipoyl-[GcvH]:protein N-lipoyltransferase n=1 Tax=Arthrobacter saudimassiliensis TaxID=1461584 RepID=A0A078MPS3_9MICC|nr:Lipoyl-[GcvH]:protein N-lipoyltransferase [Arthrobacter saudimassiliensis]